MNRDKKLELASAQGDALRHLSALLDAVASLLELSPIEDVGAQPSTVHIEPLNPTRKMKSAETIARVLDDAAERAERAIPTEIP